MLLPLELTTNAETDTLALDVARAYLESKNFSAAHASEGANLPLNLRWQLVAHSTKLNQAANGLEEALDKINPVAPTDEISVGKGRMSSSKNRHGEREYYDRKKLAMEQYVERIALEHNLAHPDETLLLPDREKRECFFWTDAYVTNAPALKGTENSDALARDLITKFNEYHMKLTKSVMKQPRIVGNDRFGTRQVISAIIARGPYLTDSTTADALFRKARESFFVEMSKANPDALPEASKNSISRNQSYLLNQYLEKVAKDHGLELADEIPFNYPAASVSNGR